VGTTALTWINGSWQLAAACTGLVLAIGAGGWGLAIPQEPAQPPAAAEVLPAGAVARLGEARFIDHGRPSTLAFSRNGAALAVGGWDGTIQVWDLQTKKLRSEWAAGVGAISALALSPDGTTAAASGFSGSIGIKPQRDVGGIRLWRIADGKAIESFEPPKARALHLVFSADGRRLASAGGGQVTLLDPANGKIILQRDTAGTIAFSADSASLRCLTGYIRGKGTAAEFGLLKFDAQTGQELKPISLPQLPVSNQVLFLSPAGSQLVFTEFSPQPGHFFIKMLDIAAGRKRLVYRGELEGGYSFGFAIGFAMSPDERCMAFAPADDQLIVAEVATGAIRCMFQRTESGKACLAFSPDGRQLACGSLDRTVLLWDLTGRGGVNRPDAPSVKAELDQLWDQLDAVDGKTANRAIWQLVDARETAVPYLEARLRPTGKPDTKRIADLLGDLAADSFQTRAKATKELEACVALAEPQLRKTLSEQPSLEVRQRVQILLEKIETWWQGQRRTRRALEVLEHVGNEAAQQALTTLSETENNPRLAEEAKASVERLRWRRAVAPESGERPKTGASR
jgi:hypothetical protein